ncbi:hypothetical protein JX265_010897 [Neoarthrinium moseri]|uniref:N-acetyltransferase domain-containing protein n=1 Tax=Neoarthrinium moseri TaxID=1658444 RepID=A0A9P9WDD7_9PEZI|nr:uncharacterized protein JN550_008992 [Neoarthrinium moseri]KAI1858229.1 hypothetical protein JX265_010897 [Neoarthrinium moseri]KAI1864435.1 hypothetical protein JN550_008992 [Neoarthrinium moseri]
MSTGFKVSVALLSDHEIPTCFQILSKSFGHDAPFVDMYFPGHDTPSGQARGSERLKQWKQNADNSTFLKAITRLEPINEERIIGFAIWTYMKEPPPADLVNVEDVNTVWPDEDDREFMTQLWKSYVIPRTQAIKGSHDRGVYVLELLAVHPDYQRLGAGTALVTWGTKAADNLRIESDTIQNR